MYSELHVFWIYKWIDKCNEIAHLLYLPNNIWNLRITWLLVYGMTVNNVWKICNL